MASPVRYGIPWFYARSLGKMGMLANNYNHVLVLFSFIVAVLASYTALDMAERVMRSQGKAAHLWLIGGSFAMGFGIWSMHFIGMLAFSLPIPLGYDPVITAGSLLIAIIASGSALWLVCQKSLPTHQLWVGAGFIGCGIAAMHYTGMAALRMQPGITYHLGWLALSIIVAILASGAAIWLAFRLRESSPHIKLLRAISALVMGIAIVGMHYTGMAAASFPEGSFCGAAVNGVDSNWLAVVVIVVTLSILGITLVVSVLDERLQARTNILTSSLAEVNRELMHLALHDSLTKLPNRVLLEDRMGQALQLSRHEGSSFAVMFLDLDGFKAVNDAFGHHLGDQLLVAVADRIRKLIQTQDVLARFGGDEFVLLMRIGEPNEASTQADLLVRTLSEPFNVSRHELRVSASIGIAVYPGDGETERDLLLHADAAMYHTKNAGRCGYSFFKSSMNANAQEHLQMLNDLRSAIARQQMRLHYQPKFQAPSGPVLGFEALLRWEHPQQGLLYPDTFLEMAEKTALIVQLGNWVIDEACRQLRVWRDQGHDSWTIAINLSAKQFDQGDLIMTVLEAVERHQIPPSCLIIEITETVAMLNPEASIKTLMQLGEFGVQASIDDFGTGYSSLLYLKRLPASELKIDKAFVRDLSIGSEDAVIVSAIVALGKALGLNIVAEGVETAEQQTFLTGLGCNTLQGHLLARPLTVEQVERQLGANGLSHQDVIMTEAEAERAL